LVDLLTDDDSEQTTITMTSQLHPSHRRQRLSVNSLNLVPRRGVQNYSLSRKQHAADV
jgi:hypothetical protein